jgi:hypothetical protein
MKRLNFFRATAALALLAGAVAGAPESRASCGTAFCMVNTSWNIEGVPTEPGARLDLRYEFIEQDQPRSGSNKVGVGQIRQHHDEVRTTNHNLLATFDYAFNQRWGISATLPVTDRNHSHIHNHGGAQLNEEWSFRNVGDLRILGRRQWQGESAEAQRLDFYGVQLGAKLATGRQDVRNADGDLAERSLQPGTGTTDLLAGAYFRRMLGSGNSWFANLLVQKAMSEHDNFRPGAQTSVDVGHRWEVTDQLGAMLQMNALHKARDRGADAEPGSSGGKFLFLSPGLGYLVAKNVQVYGFLQLPVYQYVNGVQLTADWAAVAGVSARF